MIKTIKRNDYPEIWDDLIEDWLVMDMDHRKGATFYTTFITKIDELNAPNNPEIHGYWRSNSFIWSDDDYDSRSIDTLDRVEKQTKTITVEEWVTV